MGDQGHIIDKPSLVKIETAKLGEEVFSSGGGSIEIGGQAVLMAKGEIYIDR